MPALPSAHKQQQLSAVDTGASRWRATGFCRPPSGSGRAKPDRPWLNSVRAAPKRVALPLYCQAHYTQGDFY